MNHVSRRINELAWQAYIDIPFREGLLNGRRHEIVATLDLTEAEREAVLSMQADTLEGLCKELCQITEDSPNRISLLPANYCLTTAGTS